MKKGKSDELSLTTLPPEIRSMISNVDSTYLVRPDTVNLDHIVKVENLRSTILDRKGRPKNKLHMTSRQFRADAANSVMNVKCKQGEFAFPLSVPSWKPSQKECVPSNASLQLDALQHVAPTTSAIQGCENCDSNCETEGALQNYLLNCVCNNTINELRFDFYPSSSHKARWIANVIRVRKNIRKLYFGASAEKTEVDLYTPDLQRLILGANPGSNVVKWNLSFNRIVTYLKLRVGPTGAITIAEALKVNAVLNNLDLWGSEMGPTGATALAEALKVNAVLNTLNLWGNGIGDEGATALAEGLKVNAVLKKLFLYDNHIGDAGAAAIGEGLKFNAVLNNLDIGYNKIGDTGAAALGEALKFNAVLNELYLSHNKIGDAGAAALAEALKFNAVLNTLSLGGNEIGDTGATALGEALKVNAVLKNLNLNNNRIGDAGVTALAGALKVNVVQNRTIHTLKSFQR